MYVIVYLALTWMKYFTWNMFTYIPQENALRAGALKTFEQNEDE